ncbi:fatty acid desaturase CarF family protein [endosymbiont of unidentified scaly snail isolate Monju]|uniref:fatty acid desaturase CarF family protein n=1 Tax=endosymbiont of unidentified scaly snail isolate Monju TaxID=1248727 RepID=UPI0003891CE6|nr:fatty acid desaturase CarF family protein [endosymbiont of unidentified scaly snail isolate Monju]BAN68109.1 conserved hypothetical protein [endosymbiont of unidentified scaly snail isolate Monju]
MYWWQAIVVLAWAMLSLVFAWVLWALETFSDPVAWGVVIVAVFVADAGSYVFHYVVDHYGRPRPGGVVHAFQRHHLIPDGIVQKPVVEVLYPAARIVTPLEALLLLGVSVRGEAGWWVLALLVLSVFWVLAQLCHRWSHRPPGRLVRGLQAAGILVSPSAHQRHHEAPYDSHFAVITGWSNPLFDGFGLPRRLDRLMQCLGLEKRGLVRNLRELEARE